MYELTGIPQPARDIIDSGRQKGDIRATVNPNLDAGLIMTALYGILVQASSGNEAPGTPRPPPASQGHPGRHAAAVAPPLPGRVPKLDKGFGISDRRRHADRGSLVGARRRRPGGRIVGAGYYLGGDRGLRRPGARLLQLGIMMDDAEKDHPRATSSATWRSTGTLQFGVRRAAHQAHALTDNVPGLSLLSPDDSVPLRVVGLLRRIYDYSTRVEQRAQRRTGRASRRPTTSTRTRSLQRPEQEPATHHASRNRTTSSISTTARAGCSRAWGGSDLVGRVGRHRAARREQLFDLTLGAPSLPGSRGGPHPTGRSATR